MILFGLNLFQLDTLISAIEPYTDIERSAFAAFHSWFHFYFAIIQCSEQK